MASVAKRTWSHNGAAKTAWIVRYFDGAVRRQKKFELKKDAEIYRRKVENEVERRLHVAPGETVLIGVLIEEYLDRMNDRVRNNQRCGRSHYQSVEIALRKHVKPQLGATLTADLSYNAVYDLAVALGRSAKISAGTARRILGFLKLCLDHGMRRGYVHRNVATEVLRDLPGISRRKVQTFTAEEVRRLVSDVGRSAYGHDRTHELTRCAVLLAAFCGLRFGEIMGLSWTNLDFDQGLISVRASLTHWDELKGPKSAAGVRDVPMPPQVSAALVAWRRYSAAEPRGLIFRLSTGKRIDPQNFHLNYWRPLLERAGLGPATLAAVKSHAGRGEAQNAPRSQRYRGLDWRHFHALRHFYASMLIAGGMPVTDTANMLGHANFDMTLRVYAHPTMTDTRRQHAVGQMVTALIASGGGARVTQEALTP